MGASPLNGQEAKGNAYRNYRQAAPGAAQGETILEDEGCLFGNEKPQPAILPVEILPIMMMPEPAHCHQQPLRSRELFAVKAAKPKKHGFFHQLGDFFKGVGNGIKHMVQSLLNPKNWLFIAGAIAL